MRVDTAYERVIHWDDISKDFTEEDVTVKLEIGDNIAKASDDSYFLKIELRFRIYPKENDSAVFSAITESAYEKFPDKGKTTLEQLTLLYKRPYVVLKHRFDTEKKGTNLEPIQIPDFRKDMQCIQDAFQTHLPDLGLL